MRVLSSVNFQIGFASVLAHIGINENSLADNAAKKVLVSNSAQIFQILYTIWTSSWNYQQLRRLMISSFQQIAINTKFNTNLKNLNIWTSPRGGCSCPVCTWATLKLPTFMFSTSNPICSTCNVPISVQHIHITCSHFESHRNIHSLLFTLYKIIFDYQSNAQKPSNISQNN